jgi:uncharacterized membrane protein YczE
VLGVVAHPHTEPPLTPPPWIDPGALVKGRPTLPLMVQLLVGLALFGAGESLIVLSALGNTPWTVLAEGVASHTALSIGTATVVLSIIVLLAWIPLRQALGIGTVLNALVLSLVAPADAIGLRAAEVVGGILLIGIGSGLYLGCHLGPGPRDGLMTGLHRRTGRSLRLLRTAIEGSALILGVLLGGTVGIGTLLFALTIGPAVQHALALSERLLPAGGAARAS